MNKRKLWMILVLVLAVAAGVATGLWRSRRNARIDPAAHALKEQKVTLITLNKTQSRGNGIPLVLINQEHPCPPVDEQSLIRVYARKDRGFSLANSDIMLKEDTFEAAEAMFKAAAADGVDGFILTSGYRNAKEQQALYEADPVSAQKPGASEHESGLAFDVTAYGNKDFSATAQFEWLYKHCWDYGFILRYPSDKTNITGVPAESWHYRYVGLPHSRIMGELGLCLEEYVDYIKEQGAVEASYAGKMWEIAYDPSGSVGTFHIE